MITQIMIRKKRLSDKIKQMIGQSTAFFSSSKRITLTAVGVLVISGLLVVQLRAQDHEEAVSLAAEEGKSAYQVTQPTPADEHFLVTMFHEWRTSGQEKSPIPSGNPTPLPTFTPTPTPTATPTPTPTNTPTPSPTPLPTSTPTPTPERPPQPAPQHMDEWFRRYSAEYGADEALLRKIAACESGYNTSSHNTTYDYAGMYQFAHATWVSTRMQMGADPNPDLRFNGEEAIKTAAFKVSRGGAGAWGNCL